MSDWKDNLGSFFEDRAKAGKLREQSDVERFISNVAVPALESLRDELTKHGRTVSMRTSPTATQLVVQHEGSDEFGYYVQSKMFPGGMVPYTEVVAKQRKGIRLIRTESMYRSDTSYTINDITKEEVIEHFLKEYTSRVRRDD